MECWKIKQANATKMFDIAPGENLNIAHAIMV